MHATAKRELDDERELALELRAQALRLVGSESVVVQRDRPHVRTVATNEVDLVRDRRQGHLEPLETCEPAPVRCVLEHDAAGAPREQELRAAGTARVAQSRLPLEQD